jgi:hypothetical protein
MKYSPFLLLLFVVLACRQPEASDYREADTPKKGEHFFPSIEYTTPRWTRHSTNRSMVQFEIRNTSDRPMEYLKLEVSLYDKDDTFLSSGSIYIERWERLDPGQRSSVTKIMDAEPKMALARYAFSGRELGKRDTLNVDGKLVKRLGE